MFQVALSTNDAIVPFLIGSSVLLFIAMALITLMVFYQKKMLQKQMAQQALETNHQQQMMLAQMESQENERRRVAKDLHDDVGLMLQALRTTTLAVLKDAPKEDRNDVQQMVSEVTDTVRRICWDLMPSSLEYFGLTETVDELCHRLTKRGNVPITFSTKGTETSIDKNKQMLLYRMVQELADNAIKHANASAMLIKFIWGEAHLQINVIDNGIGFSPSTMKQRMSPGYGLFSIESRAELLPAKFSFDKNIPHGTVAKIIFPFPRP